MTNPDDYDYDISTNQQEIADEQADYNYCSALSNDDGWFYDDVDDYNNSDFY